MAASIEPLAYVSFQEYLEQERKSEFRHEYVAGIVFAMAGGSLNHSRIGLDAATCLSVRLRGKGCEAVGSDQRLAVPGSDFSAYPDVTVICGEPVFVDDRKDVLADATVVVEVLSPSTQQYDRGDKFEYYRQLPSLRDYVLLRQDRVAAELRTRQSDGSWVMRYLEGREASIDLPSIGCQLPLAEVYGRVSFETPDLARDGRVD